MVNESLIAISQASDLTDLTQQTTKLVHEFGFGTFAVIGIRTDLHGRGIFESYHNIPESYMPQFKDADNGRRDPIMQHVKRFSAPILWDQNNYVDAGEADLFDQQAPFGLKFGIAVAIHLPCNRHVVVGFERPDPLPTSVGERTEMLARFQLYSAYFADAAERLLINPSASGEAPDVSPREREAILWTSLGKTAWEIGQILSLSESMVNKLLGAIQHKLGCVSKAQTVAKAIRIGIIT